MKLISVFTSWVLLTLSVATSAQEPSPTTTAEALDKPYEIVITPTISRAGLRDLIAGVEEDFFTKFNELNIEDAYDIVCYKYTPTMSHISRRVCEPIFMLKTRSDMASRVATLLGSKWVGTRTSADMFHTSDHELVKEKRDDYRILQELMEEFTQSDREFREIGEVLAQLKSRLENYNRND